MRPWKRRPEILLCPNIPRPLHGMAPRVVLGGPWWDKTRQAAYESTNYRCQACGVHKSKARFNQWLEGHELYDTDYERGRLTYVETVPLCPICHAFIHDGRLRWLLDSGKITQGRFVATIQHGEAVLEEAGLRRPTWTERDAEIRRAIVKNRCAAWADWRLVVDGVEYPPLHGTIEEQERARRK